MVSRSGRQRILDGKSCISLLWLMVSINLKGKSAREGKLGGFVLHMEGHILPQLSMGTWQHAQNMVGSLYRPKSQSPRHASSRMLMQMQAAQADVGNGDSHTVA